MKGFWTFAAPISIVLTTTTWIFFRYSSSTAGYSLSAPETTTVFAFWLAAAVGFRWLWRKCVGKGT